MQLSFCIRSALFEILSRYGVACCCFHVWPCCRRLLFYWPSETRFCPLSPLLFPRFVAFQAVRCQVLDYFFRQREGLREDHVLFSFEQSMTFSKAEFGLIDQV